MHANQKLKLLILSVLFFPLTKSFADEPGKRHMEDSKVTFQDLGKWKDYEFHWEAEYGSRGLLYGDTTVILPRTSGAPGDAFFWALNKTTGKSTDTIFFSNYYDPDYVIILKSISGDSLKYKMTKLSNANATGDEDKGGLGDIKNQKLIEDARVHAYSKNTKYLLMIGLPVLALIIMIVYFIIRRKRKAMRDF
ncbi:MAG: hypothetical protein ABIQ56_00580 [Chitinophagaceae bacterium]